MPIAVTPNETWKYQLEDDYLEKPERAPDGTITKKGKTNPNGTWWRLKALPAHIEQQITDAIEFEFSEGETRLVHANRGTVQRLILQHGVDGVENWRDAQGRDVPIKKTTLNGRDVADLGFIEYLRQDHRAELASAIEQRLRVTVDEAD